MISLGGESKSERISSGRDTERARRINKYRTSGLGLQQFARRHGLQPGQLHYWVYQAPKPLPRRATLLTFQEVRLP
ncbi:MAG: hypothetical protein KA118_16810, partial [Verrucomicrobia bacterium]|nr:hypothetical protein [Verrucomicrobiota bacterium]